QRIGCCRIDCTTLLDAPLSLEDGNQLSSCISKRLRLTFALQRSDEFPAGPFVVTKNRTSLEELLQRVLQIGHVRPFHRRFQGEGDFVHDWSLLAGTRFCQDAEPLRGTTAHENRGAPG